MRSFMNSNGRRFPNPSRGLGPWAHCQGRRREPVAEAPTTPSGSSLSGGDDELGTGGCLA
jgi:hypothetical protein